jgi:hypothetical protein
VAAAKLKKGEHLKAPDDTVAVADGGSTPAQHDGWMWDLTIPGNNDHDFYVFSQWVASDHAYYLKADAPPVLVHNSGCKGISSWTPHAADQVANRGISEDMANNAVRREFRGMRPVLPSTLVARCGLC